MVLNYGHLLNGSIEPWKITFHFFLINKVVFFIVFKKMQKATIYEKLKIMAVQKFYI